MKEAILIDIDGTLALRGERDPFDFSKVLNDQPNKKLIVILRAIITYKKELELIFISGRMDSCRNDTELWLKKYCSSLLNGSPPLLLMRATDDFRDDYVVKQELYEQEIKVSYRVFLIFDDRNQVVNMWRSLGLTCYQVANGDF